jgi:hypothetical protein
MKEENIKFLKRFQMWHNDQPSGSLEGEFDGFLSDSTVDKFLKEMDVKTEINPQTGEIIISGSIEEIKYIRDKIYKKH